MTIGRFDLINRRGQLRATDLERIQREVVSARALSLSPGSLQSSNGVALAPPTQAAASTFTGCSLYFTNITVTNATLTPLTIHAVDATQPAISWDTSAFFNAASPTILTIPTTGYYALSAWILWPSSANGTGTVSLEIDSAAQGQLVYDLRLCNNTPKTLTNDVAGPAFLAAGDTLQAQVVQNSGGSVSFLTGGQFSAVKVG